MQTNVMTIRQKIGLVLAALFLAVCFSLYAGRKNAFAPTTPTTTGLAVTNPLVLQNWLPTKSYDYTVARLNDYASAQNLETSSITVANGVIDDRGAYAFTVMFNPDSTQYHIDVLVNNFDSVISTSVSVEGVKQEVSVSNSNQGTTFIGIDSLLTRGLTSIQGNNLQAAFTKYDPGARTITIDTLSISSRTVNSGNSNFAQLMDFSVSVDSKSFSAQLDYTDISAVRLTLFDADGKQVFDSGKVDSAS